MNYADILELLKTRPAQPPSFEMPGLVSALQAHAQPQAAPRFLSLKRR
jgi:hypothetical protein